MSTRGEEPWKGLSCLSRNIWHFNWQNHVTEPVSFIWVFKKAEFSLYVKKSRYLSVCVDASCSSAVRRCVCPLQQEAGSRSHCPVSTHDNNVTQFYAKNIYLCLSTMNGGSESQLQHTVTTSMWLSNSFWRHFWISVVSLSQTSFHTLSTVGETPPGNVMTVCVD